MVLNCICQLFIVYIVTYWRNTLIVMTSVFVVAGLEPGTVVVTEKAVDGEMNPYYKLVLRVLLIIC